MNAGFVERFPGAAILDERAFSEAIVGRKFQYRGLRSEIIVERPIEVFQADGRYELHGLRAIAHERYRFRNGVVSIDGSTSFFGLSRERIFFRRDGMLLTANADGTGPTIELISK